MLLVPSLINRHYVMDLLPGKSMAQDLVAAGHDVYCIDWGTPGDEDRFVSFDDVCDKYLGRTNYVCLIDVVAVLLDALHGGTLLFSAAYRPVFEREKTMPASKSEIEIPAPCPLLIWRTGPTVGAIPYVKRVLRN